VKTVAVPDLFTIGEFSRTTHLSVKALRHYHDVGLLAPTEIDPVTGYRSYAVAQVPLAQVIRRLRDLDMPLDQVQAVLDASKSGDVAERDRVLHAHLEQMERQLEQTQVSVSSLRALLVGDRAEAEIEHRSAAPTLTLAIRDRVAWDDAEAWLADAFGQLHAELDAGAGTVAGPDGALYASDFFEAHSGEVTAFVPVLGAPSSSGRAEVFEMPAAELAVIVHRGAFDELDQAYAALGSFVASRAIGGSGPIREHYLEPEGDHPSELRTEVAWPVSGPFA
jgi:DNA-binding transcriptional MerR regulator/effector-binding domain-containing protein